MSLYTHTMYACLSTPGKVLGHMLYYLSKNYDVTVSEELKSKQ